MLAPLSQRRRLGGHGRGTKVHMFNDNYYKEIQDLSQVTNCPVLTALQ